MPRLFTAIRLPSDVAFALSLLRGDLPGARWIEPEDYHVTLRFIGDVDNETADEVVSTLDRVDRFGFSLELSGLGTFGTRKPRALWAAVVPNQPLRELQAEHERRMQRLGLPPEGRKFTPHVTIARLNGGVSPADLDLWVSRRLSFRAGPFPVERFALMSARASKGGGPYVTEELFALKDPAREARYA